MSEFNISIPGGESKRLLTGGKYCPDNIVVTAEGGLPVVEKDVNFFDYDGTLLYSYTLAEAQALTELPPLPTHTGLICQGWNWTLEGVKALTRHMTIGASYITDDGATRLYMSFNRGSRLTVPLHFSQTVANGVTVYWGDGTEETLAGTGVVSTAHTYATHGDYVIRLLPVDGCVLSLGNGTSTTNIFGGTADALVYNSAHLDKAEIGKNVTTIGSYAFYRCRQMRTVTIPTSVTGPQNAQGCFWDCFNLSLVVIPYGATRLAASFFQNASKLFTVSLSETIASWSDTVFYGCASLRYLDCPDAIERNGWGGFGACSALLTVNTKAGTLTSGSDFKASRAIRTIVIKSGNTGIAGSAFENCTALSEIVIPGSTATVGASAFANCYGMKEYDFSACSAVPTLANANAFTGLPADCVIKVPASLRDEWAAATNWSTYASQIVGV